MNNVVLGVFVLSLKWAHTFVYISKLLRTEHFIRATEAAKCLITTFVETSRMFKSHENCERLSLRLDLVFEASYDDFRLEMTYNLMLVEYSQHTISMKQKIMPDFLTEVRPTLRSTQLHKNIIQINQNRTCISGSMCIRHSSRNACHTPTSKQTIHSSWIYSGQSSSIKE